MNKILTFSVLLLVGTTLSGQKLEVKFQETLDSIYKTTPKSIGIMAHVESPEQNISWSGAVGYPDKNNSRKLEPDETVWVASITKTYVSATILRLVEEDKINIDQSISGLITDQTQQLFESDGYKLDEITIAHLLSHTSGINDYVGKEFFELLSSKPMHRWTRDEQLELAVNIGSPLGEPGEVYVYSDTNFLILSEIIENIAGDPFYITLRKLLRFEQLDLNNTWFPILEEQPVGTKNLVHQYYDEYNWDTYDIDASFDLYGGGGIAGNTKDLARFSYNLFNGIIIKDTNVLNLIFTKIQTEDSIQSNYHLGLMSDQFGGFKAYGHTGFWGTFVYYFPDLKSSISVFVLKKEEREISRAIINQIIGILQD